MEVIICDVDLEGIGHGNVTKEDVCEDGRM
jgi:hypothetical protein